MKKDLLGERNVCSGDDACTRLTEPTMNQRGLHTQENKDLLTISAQGETVRNVMCRTGAAFRRAAATEICLKCQTAQQTAAAGVEETEC